MPGGVQGRQRGVSAGYAKPNTTLKENTGQKGVMVTCAIGAGNVLMWHVVPGQWNGRAAAAMYSGPLRKCLLREFPDRVGNWRVLEDNDPSGYKSRLGNAAKAASSITAMSLPPRSPDLNPLDFSFWADVTRKVREHERAWPKSKREARAAFLARLRKTAMSMPEEYIEKIIGAIAGRCQKVIGAKGGHIVEGS